MFSSAPLTSARWRLLAVLVFFLSNCANDPRGPTAVEPIPTPQRIPVCSGYGCRIIDTVSLDDVEWRAVRAIFHPRASSAVDERQQIARAIALIERFIGPKTDTPFYLRLLVADGLIRWHAVGPDATRGYFLFGWPHTTATMREKSSDTEYVVDSWFFDNGAEPVIIPLEQWRDGWDPPAAK